MQRLDPAAAVGIYPIREFSALFDVSFKTLRFYEERELLRPERRGKRRLFTENDRTRMEVILKAKRFGFSLAAIWELLDARGCASMSTAGVPLNKAEIERQIAELTGQRSKVHQAIEELQVRFDSFNGSQPR